MEKIFTIDHLGGEYLSVNVSGLKQDTDSLFRITDEMLTWIKRPSVTKNIGYHIYDTEVTNESAERIISSLEKHRDNIFRFCFVGMDFRGRNRIKKCMRKRKLAINHSFIFDLNKAKDWLVGKMV